MIIVDYHCARVLRRLSAAPRKAAVALDDLQLISPLFTSSFLAWHTGASMMII